MRNWWSLDAIDDVDERKEGGEPELRRKANPKLPPIPLLALLLLLTGEVATTSGRAGKGGS